MATPAQINANRRNAAQSTGPKTPAGKLIVSKNTTKHGLFTDGLSDEDPVAFAELQLSMYGELSPDGEIENHWWTESSG